MKFSFFLLSLLSMLCLVHSAVLAETNSRTTRAAWDSLSMEKCFETQGRDELSCRGKALREQTALRALRFA